MSTLSRKVASVVTSLIAGVLTLVLAVACTAGWGSFDAAWGNASAQEIIKKVSAEGSNRGWSKAAIAGLLGNMDTESSFRVNASNGLGCIGLVQFCGGRATNLRNAVPDWDTNADAQIKYIFDEMGDGSFVKLYNGNISWYASEVSGLGSCSAADFNAFKGLDDPKCATVVFAATHERCGNMGAVEVMCAINSRANFAQQAYDSGKIDGSSGGSSDDKKEDAGGGSDDGSRGDMITEDDLEGMPDRNDYAATGDLKLPAEELQGMDGYSVALLMEARETVKQADDIGLMRGIIMLVGVLIFIYGIALGMAYLFDRSNTLFQFSLLGAITFGRLTLVDSKYDASKTRATGSRVLFMMGLCLVSSVLVLSGGLTNGLLKLVWWSEDFFNSLPV